MKIVREITALKLDRKHSVALVPTMGAFHEGHLHLMRKARERCRQLVVSLFVNPTQFGQGEDYSRYPRNEERDFELAASVGVDVLFAPSVEEMYPSGLTTIHVAELTELWEGAFRPGHFDGVATVVAKLFNIVRPNLAIFGEKDYQQCRVIERMVLDLNMPVELLFEPTVREADGLAMSSRNKYLEPKARAAAPSLYAELSKLSKSLPGIASEPEVQEMLNDSALQLTSSGFNIDYLELVNAATLVAQRDPSSETRIIAAARLGHTRLIDNTGLGKGPSK